MKNLRVVVVFAFFAVLCAGPLFAGATHEVATTPVNIVADDPGTLYELAKQEGKVVIYSVSSRIKTAVTSFMETYPGIVVEAYDMRMPTILEKLERESAAGIKNADVILGNDNSGTLTYESLQDGLITTWIPSDMNDLLEEFKESELYDFTVELVSLFYNNEVYPTSPINSWWDLTLPQWKGKVMMPDPMSAPELLSLFGAFSKHSTEMAADYEKQYGRKLVLNGTADAGYEYMKRLLANDVVIVDSQGKAVTAIGTPGQKDPSFCIVVSSKLRTRLDGLNIAIATELTPVVGVTNPTSLIMVTDCPHPNAAKLLIRWIAGETDGQGAGFDGFKVIGAWPTRSSGNSVSDQNLDALDFWTDNHKYMYQNGLKLRDAWLMYQ